MINKLVFIVMSTLSVISGSAATVSIELLQTQTSGAGSDGVVNLSTEGAVDWIQWDGIDHTNFSRKAGGSAISTWSPVGTFTSSLFTDSGYQVLPD